MKKYAALVLVALAACMALTLGACGQDHSKNFQGEWTATSVTVTDSSVEDAESTARMFKLVMDAGYSITLNLNENGKCEMSVAGSEPSTGTWKARSATECELTLDNSASAKATLADNKLTIDDSGVALTFERK